MRPGPQTGVPTEVKARLQESVEYLCSERCLPRIPGTRGGRTAQRFVLEAFEDLGLAPAGESGYLQPIPEIFGANVIGMIPGSSTRSIIIAAHFDACTIDGGVNPGASDNAASVAAMLEVAKKLEAGKPLDRTIVFIGFDAEEPPYFQQHTMGSRHFVAHPTIELEDVDLMICLDMIGHATGNGNDPDIARSMIVFGSEKSSEVSAVLAEVPPVEGLTVRRVDVDLIDQVSDYSGFQDAGIPFLFYNALRNEHYHATTDTPGTLDYRKIDALVAHLTALIQTVADRPLNPFTYVADSRIDVESVATIRALLPTLPPTSRFARSAPGLLDGLDERAATSLAERDRQLLKRLFLAVEDGLLDARMWTDTEPPHAPAPSSVGISDEVRELIGEVINRFPDPPQPLGVEPAMVRPIVGGDPFMGDPAVGEVNTEVSDTLMLEVPNHRPGQVRSLLSLVERDTISRIDIHSGSISADDLAAISGAFIDEVRFGKPRVGLEPPDPIEMNFIDGASLSKLSGPRSLHVLNVPFTDKNLARVGTTSLETLFLSGITADSSLLSRFKFLTTLFMDGCEGSDDLSFLESMPNLFGFGFRFSRLTTDQLRHIKKCTQLRVLDIAYNRHLGPDLSVLDGYPSLLFLDISTTRADDTTLASIGDMRFLEHLNAQCVGITDAGIAPLRNQSGLAHLNLAGNRITDAGLASLAGTLPRLRTLDLRDTEITVEGVVNLIPQFPEIRVLGVSGNLLNAEVADHLKRNTDIDELHICAPLEGDGWIEAVDTIGSAKFGGKPV